MSPISAARLEPEFDSGLLQAQLTGLFENSWIEHVNQKDYQGPWHVLPLRCAAENIDAHPILQAFAIQQSGSYQNLPIIQNCTELLSLFDRLHTEVLSVRLMRLNSGAKIHPHCDNELSVEHQQARLHIPIKTNKGVTFKVNEHVLPMQAGELWYINAHRTHSVKNYGDQARINLVIDCKVNKWLQQQVHTAKHKIL